MTELKDYYHILGVDKTSSPDEIKKAYRKLALRYHPDRNPGDKNAEDRFKLISEAYAVLINPSKRAQYDRSQPAADETRAEAGQGWKGNAAVEPADHLELARGWHDRGASILGGCCGTTPAHIAALASFFRAKRPR